MKKLLKSDVCESVNSIQTLYKGEKSKVPAFKKKKKKLRKRKCASGKRKNALPRRTLIVQVMAFPSENITL